MWSKKDLISIDEISRQDIEFVLRCAKILEPLSGRGNKLGMCRGEIATLAFFEPSTRTEKSFQSAMYTLGGDVILHKDTGSSREKGETKADTLRTLEQYSDIIVIRDPESNSVAHYADLLDVPVINAGDGSNEHPTQTLFDLYTIKKEVGRLEGLKILFIGDLRYGRTVHSLIKASRKFSGNTFFGISPETLSLPEQLKGNDFQETSMEEFPILEPDIIYATRIQKERIAGKEDFSYEINRKTLEALPQKTKIMHPLPRVGELNPEIDSDHRFLPFKQARCALQTRMAILALMLGHEQELLELGKI